MIAALKRMFRRPAVLAGLLALLLLDTCITLVASDSPGRLLARFPQPARLDYHSFGPYEVQLFAGPLRWRILGWHRGLLLHICRQGAPEQGHDVLLDILGAGAEDLSLDWRPEGIAVRLGTGHRVWIPRAAFVGGR